MAVGIGTLRKQIHLPQFEWCRVAPATTAAVSTLLGSQKKDARYLYYILAAAIYRYDTITDGWTQLTTMGDTPTTVLAADYLPHWGMQGRVIATGSTSSKTQIPSLTGQTMVGYEIEIVDGKGKGQVRTITAVTEPTVHETGYATAGAATSLTDTTGGVMRKAWRPNMWGDYTLRIVNGTGAGQSRRILYNTHQVLTIADYGWAAQDANFYAPWGTNPAAGSMYQIESCVITVNTAWTTEPDHTSRFNIRSGAIMVFSGRATPQWQIWHYYSCLEDVWYQRTVAINLWDVTAAQGTDCTVAAQYPLTDANGVANGNVTGGANGSTADYTIEDSGASWTVGAFRNLCITMTKTSTGRTQTRRILANNATKIWVTEKWETAPTGTGETYVIHPAHDKVWLMGGAVSSLYRYDLDDDLWLPSQMYECGVARGMAVQKRENSRNVGRAYGVASGSRVTDGVVSVAIGAAGSGYRVDEQLTVSTGTGCLVRITAVDTAGAVTAVLLEWAGSGYTNGTKATTGGSGSSCTITVTCGAVATLTLVLGHHLQLGDTITVTGDTSAGNYYNVTDATIIGLSTTLTLQYAVNASAAASASFTAQSTTVLYDYAKNWTVNEHANKMLIIFAIQSGNQIATTQARKITSNTATSITVPTITAAVTGTSRYAIVDPRLFGTHCTFNGDDTRSGLMGVATGIDGGATAKTSLQDTTKAWPINFWKDGAARKVRILTGPLMGLEIAVASNSANTLYWSAQASEVDANTVYAIYDNYGYATGGSGTTLVDSTQNWVTNQHAGKRLKVIGNAATDTTNHGDEVAISGVTAPSTLTASLTTTPLAGSQYAVLTLPVVGAGQNLEFIAHRSTGDGATLDKTKCARNLILLRGGGTSQYWRYDIVRGIWEMINPSPSSYAAITFTTGAAMSYDHMDRCYIMSDVAAGRVFCLNLATTTIDQAGQVDLGIGTAVLGCRGRIIETVDGLKLFYGMRHGSTEMFRILCWW